MLVFFINMHMNKKYQKQIIGMDLSRGWVPYKASVLVVVYVHVGNPNTSGLTCATKV